MAVIGGVVVLALVVGGGLLWRQYDDRGRLTAGASRAGDYSMSDGYFSESYSLTVPGARILVNVEAGRRGSKLDDATYESTRVKAPRDGLLVHLDWSAVRSGNVDSTLVDAHRSSLRIRSKDTSVVVDRKIVPTTRTSYDDDDRDQKVVALRGDLGDLKLEVEFAGRKQTVSLLSGRRDMGRFASLYGAEVVNNRVVAIEQDQPTDVRSPFRWYCKALSGRLIRTPYLDGLGWAAPSREWILASGAGARVPAEAATWRDGEHSAYYSVAEKPTVSVTVAGKKPVKVLSQPQTRASGDISTTSADYVFSAEAGAAVTTVVTVSVSLERGPRSDAKAPARTTIQPRTTTSYPAVQDPTIGVRR